MNIQDKIKGKYIVVEGPGGSGKTSVINILKDKLSAKNFFFVKEPDGPIRDILLSLSNDNMDVFTEICLFTAWRCELIRKTIIPKLDSGINIISDRNFYSSKAHQIEGSMRKDLSSVFNKMTEIAVGCCPVDMGILLTADIDELLKRKKGRTGEVDKFDERDVSFQRRVVEGYFEHFPKGKPHLILHTDGKTAEESGQIVLEHILNFLKI